LFFLTYNDQKHITDRKTGSSGLYSKMNFMTRWKVVYKDLL